MDADRLKELRRQQGYSQLDLALEAGISTATLWRLEGGRGSAHSATIDRLASTLGVDPAGLRG